MSFKEVYAFAAGALGIIGDARAVEPLTQALCDKDRYIQGIAKEVLKKIKSNKN